MYRTIEVLEPAKPSPERRRPRLQRSTLSSSHIDKLFTSDQSLWNSPLTLFTLRDWYASAKLWSWVYQISPAPEDGDEDEEAIEESESYAGILFAVPLLLTAFNAIVSGELKEHLIRPEHIPQLSRSDDSRPDYGVHIFHIERTEVFRKSFPKRLFTQQCLGDMKTLSKELCGNCCGVSALVVTDSGERAFEREGFAVVGGEVIYLEGHDSDLDGAVAKVCRTEEWRDEMGTKMGEGKMFVKWLYEKSGEE